MYIWICIYIYMYENIYIHTNIRIPIYYKHVGSENDSREAFKKSASVDIIWVTRRDRDSGEQTTWIKQSLPQRNVCVGCQLNRDSDQALRLVCLKGHVRAVTRRCDDNSWQEASEFLCTKTTLFAGSWVTKKIAKKTRKYSLRRDDDDCFCYFQQ